jgi:hypothetical protein
MAIVDLDCIVDLLNERGIRAFVEMTGGGIATVYGGPESADADGVSRYTCMIGPGWFDGPGFTLARADTADLAFGPDDSGDDPDAYTEVGPDATEEDISAAVAAMYFPSAVIPRDGE